MAAQAFCDMHDIPRANPVDPSGKPLPLHTKRILELWGLDGTDADRKRVERAIEASAALPAVLSFDELRDEDPRVARRFALVEHAGDCRLARGVVLSLGR